jgi:hypothetical protein
VNVATGSGTHIAIGSADIAILGAKLDALLRAHEIAADSYRKTVQNVLLAFCFNGIGIPIASEGLFHPVWAMVVMAVSVTATSSTRPGNGPPWSSMRSSVSAAAQTTARLSRRENASALPPRGVRSKAQVGVSGATLWDKS